MESRAKLLGHPIHQQLIVFPLGLLGMAVIFDGIGYFTGDPNWTRASFYMIGAGIVTGVLAAVFGLWDYIGIPSGTRAKRIGAVHGIGNLLVVGLFLVSFAMRWPDPANTPLSAYLSSGAGFLLALFTGWLGGELVDRLGVGVDDGAHLDAPSSLTEARATHPVHHRPPTI
jgi:uncharacterized membrane protein